MKTETIDFFNQLLEQNKVPAEVIEDIRSLITANVKPQALAQPAPIEPQYLQPREGLIPVSATTGPYNEKKWKKFFKSGIENYTGEDWETVITGCGATPAGKMTASDLVKDGMYRQFIKDEPQNFFTGIESAFQAVEDNSSLVKEVLENDRRIHVPFTNAEGARFVVLVFKSYGLLYALVFKLSHDDVWFASYGYVVLFPQHKSL